MYKYIDIHVQVSSHRYLSQWIVLHIKQGVVTLVRPVEPIAAGIKQMKSRINISIDTKSSNLGMRHLSGYKNKMRHLYGFC